METVEWQYQPTPEEIKKAKLVPRILSIVFHFSGVIYLLIYYFSETKSNTFAISLAVTYLSGLLVWHLYLKKTIGLFAETVSISEQSLRIFNLDTNKEHVYNWEDLKSFSEDVNIYLPKDVPSVNLRTSLDYKFLYIGHKTKNYIMLRVPNQYIQKVESALAEKLEEVTEKQ